MTLAASDALFNKYSLRRRIGSGAFSEVWLARDDAIGRDYALKILKPDRTIDERLREARIGHSLFHENLIRIHQADVRLDGTVFIAMDFLPKGPITSYANSQDFVPLPNTIQACIDVLRGLEHLHINNFFHNDIKPNNILIGHQNQAILADFGIVGISKAGAPTSPISFYISHAAPEIHQKDIIDARTDIFQMGLTLFRLLVGLSNLHIKRLQLGDAEYAARILKGSLITKNDLPAFIPPVIRRIILKSIMPDPNARFQSALEMRRALESAKFSGYWTFNDAGKMIGIKNQYQYDFECTKNPKGLFNVDCYKINVQKNLRSRVSNFCKINLNEKQAKALIDRFISHVVIDTK